MIKSKKISKSLQKNKNNKTKTKTKITKIKIVGGAKGKLTEQYKTISNSGAIFEEGKKKYNQCFWISLRDYLNNFRGLNITVGDIKRLVNLPASTDFEQMDYWETPMYKTAVDILSVLFDIRIEFYYIKKGNSLLFINGLPVPQTIVNHTSENIVPIAFTGGHFELITSGPHLEPLSYIHPTDIMIQLEQNSHKKVSRKTRINYNTNSPPPRPTSRKPIELLNKPQPPQPPPRTTSRKSIELLNNKPPPRPSSNLKPQTYTPKFFNQSTLEYVSLEEINDKDLQEKIKSEKTINENKMLIKLYEQDTKLNQDYIKNVKDSIASLHQLEFSDKEKKALNSLYQSELKKYNDNLDKLRTLINKLQDEIETLELLVQK
jgi:hypothetical protein